LLKLTQENILYSEDSSKEDWLFPEKVLYKLKGDCEDKTIALAFLVNLFLKPESIYIVDYDKKEKGGHINLGIKDEDLKKFDEIDGLIILEPSGIDVPVGKFNDESLLSFPRTRYRVGPTAICK